MLFYAALEDLEASQAAAFIYVEPLIAQALAIGALGEPLTAGLVAGGAAILTGVWLVSRSDQARPPPAGDARATGRRGSVDGTVRGPRGDVECRWTLPCRSWSSTRQLVPRDDEPVQLSMSA
jgi:hypothetical protein